MIPTAWIEALLDVVLAPGLWVSLLLALIYSLVFSALWWGGWRQAARDMLAGLSGFAAGQLIGVLLGFRWLRVGEVQLFWGTAAAVAGLAIGRQVWQPDRVAR